MADKAVKSISIIGGADGPTSVFIAGENDKNRKFSFKQKLHKIQYAIRKKAAAKSIKAGTHTMEEVADYILNELGYVKINIADRRYQEEYKQMRAAFIIQYRPDLLGELAELPKLINHDEESIKVFLKKAEQRQKAAETVLKSDFDIDMQMFEKSEKGFNSEITIEKTYGYIGGGASGSKQYMKKYNADYLKVYRYYGVSQEDIDKHTKRYETLVNTLAIR